MTIPAILQRLTERFPEHSFQVDGLNPQAICAPAAAIPELFAFLRQDSQLDFDYFEFSTCTDRPPDHLDLLYYVYSYSQRHRLAIKVKLPRECPAVPTLSHIWTNADWNEREIYDLFGVMFTGHPDLRRLMMPEDWEGHPLLKDYAHPNLVRRPD